MKPGKLIEINVPNGTCYKYGTGFPRRSRCDLAVYGADKGEIGVFIKRIKCPSGWSWTSADIVLFGDELYAVEIGSITELP